MKKELDFSALSGVISDIGGVKKCCPTFVPTGFERLDEQLGGGLAPNLYVFGAISSIGKSTLMLQISENVSRGGTPVLYFSLEMSSSYIALISICRHARMRSAGEAGLPELGTLLNREKLNKFASSKKNSKLLTDAIADYRKSTEKLYIIERNAEDLPFSAGSISSCVYSFAEEFEAPPVVIVDYLQLLSSDDRAANERRAIDTNITELWRLAHELSTPVIVISSVNRMNYDKPIGFTAFKESGGIEFSADVVMGMQFSGTGEKGFDYNKAKAEYPRRLELTILKNRFGRSGADAGTTLRYYPAFGYFEESADAAKKEHTQRTAAASGKKEVGSEADIYSF